MDMREPLKKYATECVKLAESDGRYGWLEETDSVSRHIRNKYFIILTSRQENTIMKYIWKMMSWM
jgi:hypothetical protein